MLSFCPALDRLFEPSYRPLDQDILHCRTTTTGITETVFRLKSHEMHMLDVSRLPFPTFCHVAHRFEFLGWRAEERTKKVDPLLRRRH